MLKQSIKPLHYSSVKRSSLETSLHGSVDLHLKKLKNSSRRLHNALGAFGDEYQILERLYYKGKNQHRLSLLWRRVSEIRRLCRCIVGMHVDQVMSLLRGSFFGASNPPDSVKARKGSWTHLPDVLFLNSVSQCLSACSTLITKMQEKLVVAYRAFTMAMQYGAFLQLIMTLVAIVSRLRAVCAELHENLQSIAGITMHMVELSSAPTTVSQDPTFQTPSGHDDDDSIIHHDDYSKSDSLSPQVVATENRTVSHISMSRRTVVQRTVAGDTKPKLEYAKERKMKKSKPRDEIDDIFGF